MIEDDNINRYMVMIRDDTGRYDAISCLSDNERNAAIFAEKAKSTMELRSGRLYVVIYAESVYNWDLRVDEDGALMPDFREALDGMTPLFELHPLTAAEFQAYASSVLGMGEGGDEDEDDDEDESPYLTREELRAGLRDDEDPLDLVNEGLNPQEEPLERFTMDPDLLVTVDERMQERERRIGYFESLVELGWKNVGKSPAFLSQTPMLHLVEHERIGSLIKYGYQPPECTAPLLDAAACYLAAARDPELDTLVASGVVPSTWPWDHSLWHPSADRVINLVKAANLIISAGDDFLHLDMEKDGEND